MSYSCAVCGIGTQTDADIEMHLRKAHDVWSCTHCQRQFPTVESYVAHLEEVAADHLKLRVSVDGVSEEILRLRAEVARLERAP